MITNILDTTPAESFALMSGKMVLTLGLSGVLMVALAWWIKISKDVYKRQISFRKVTLTGEICLSKRADFR